MNGEDLRKITALRHELHAAPCLSMREQGTKRRLMDFLEENTTLAIVDCGHWFYASRYVEGTGAAAFRADMDALPVPETINLPWGSTTSGVSHKCGHDGHCAALCGLALSLERIHCPRSVYLVFQHAEETGQGGEVCSRLLQERDITEVYAFHNLSGWPENSVIVRRGLCQCASEGLTVRMKGHMSHASEPEKGRNPSFALAALINYIQGLLSKPRDCMLLCTIVNIRAGAKDFGISPADGEVSMTLRSDNEAAMKELELEIKKKAEELAGNGGLETEFEITDPFPATVSDEVCVDSVAAAAEKTGHQILNMKEPWRASEDFGWYTKRCPGAMFYIGNGEGFPALHTPEYDFNDRILETAADVFLEIYRSGCP